MFAPVFHMLWHQHASSPYLRLVRCILRMLHRPPQEGLMLCTVDVPVSRMHVQRFQQAWHVTKKEDVGSLKVPISRRRYEAQAAAVTAFMRADGGRTAAATRSADMLSIQALSRPHNEKTFQTGSRIIIMGDSLLACACVTKRCR